MCFTLNILVLYSTLYFIKWDRWEKMKILTDSLLSYNLKMLDPNTPAHNYSMK